MADPISLSSGLLTLIVFVLQKISITRSVMSIFFHPIYAFINLFMYVLKYPHGPTVMGDLALLDVATGHFDQLEHASDGMLAFHFPRECTTLCLKTIRAFKGPRQEILQTVPATTQSTCLDSLEPTNVHGAVYDPNTRDMLSYPEDVVLGDPFGAMDFETGLWNMYEFIGMSGDDVSGPFMELEDV